jgi:hypothetical protein
MTAEQKAAIKKVIESLRPEAKEFTDQMLKDPYKTTQNNYGKVMAFLTQLENQQKNFGIIFLMAMEKEGYPKTTADQLRQLLGWA